MKRAKRPGFTDYLLLLCGFLQDTSGKMSSGGRRLIPSDSFESEMLGKGHFFRCAHASSVDVPPCIVLCAIRFILPALFSDDLSKSSDSCNNTINGGLHSVQQFTSASAGPKARNSERLPNLGYHDLFAFQAQATHSDRHTVRHLGDTG